VLVFFFLFRGLSGLVRRYGAGLGDALPRHKLDRLNTSNDFK